MKRCATCDGEMPARIGSGRPRVHCESCRPPRRTIEQAVQELSSPVVQSSGDVPDGVYAATLAELESAGRVHTAKGQACLLLADRLDERVDTAAGAASAVKQLRESLDDALAGATVAADPVDELRRRREAKFA